MKTMNMKQNPKPTSHIPPSKGGSAGPWSNSRSRPWSRGSWCSGRPASWNHGGPGNGAVEDLDRGAMAGLEARAELKTTRAGGKQMTTTEEPVEQATRAEHVTKVKPAKQKTTTGLEAMVEQRHGEATWL